MNDTACFTSRCANMDNTKMTRFNAQFYFIIFSISLALTSINDALAQHPTHTQFLTHPLQPFTQLEENGQLSGFAVDIVQAMMENTFHTADVEMLPFNRAFQKLKSAKNTALFVVAKRPERESNMKWVGPIISSGVYFYQKSNSDLSLKDLEDLRRVSTIGVVQGTADHTYLNAQGFTNLSTDKAQLQSLKMLSYGRVDVAPMSELVMPFLAKAANIDINTIKRTPIKLYDSVLYIAFSNDTSDEVVALWQQAFDDLKASGMYQTIYQRYF